MKKLLGTLAASTLMLTSVGCDKKDAPPAGADKAGTEAAAPAAPVAKAYLKIPQLGIELEVPSNATIMDSGANVMISATAPECTLLVSKVGEMSSSFESTKNQIQRGLKSMVEETQTEDGWVLRYTAENGMDKTKDDHGVDVRIKAGDAQYDCSRVTESAEHADCVVAACKSIRVAQ